MHPGGVLQGQPHPVNTFFTLLQICCLKKPKTGPKFLFDVIQSATLPIALITHKPIVLIDHGMNKFNKTMKTMLSERCLILNVERDSRNRINIDAELLELSIMEATKMVPDPTPFSEMYAGDYALI